MIPDNCISMTAVRFGERVTVTVVSSNGIGKRSVTVDADSELYSLFLEVSDHVLCNAPLPEFVR